MKDVLMSNEIYTSQIGSMQTNGTVKLLNIFFVVDTSAHMRAEGRIEAVNALFYKMIPALCQFQEDYHSEFELRIAIMTFDQSARWIVPPTSILKYAHEDIICGEWVMDFSGALRSLGEKLSRKEYMAHTCKIAAPFIILITNDDHALSDDDRSELDSLKRNGWFKSAHRFIAFVDDLEGRDDNNNYELLEFASSPDSIIEKDVVVDYLDNALRPKAQYLDRNESNRDIEAFKPNESDADAFFSDTFDSQKMFFGGILKTVLFNKS